MSSEDDYSRIMSQAVKSFSPPKHNVTDYDRFAELTSKMGERFDRMTESRTREERAARIRTWDRKLVAPWNQARLSRLTDQAAAADTKRIIVDKGWGSFFVYGPPGSGKTYLALAIARRYIGMGLVSPSQVKHVSEDRIISNIRSGFKGRQEITDDLFSNQYKLYILDNVGHKNSYDGDESSMWEILMDHVVTHGLAVIFTSSHSLASFSEKLPGPAEAKVLRLVHGRTVTMNDVLEKSSAGEMTDRERKINEEHERRAEDLLKAVKPRRRRGQDSR